MPSRSRKAFLEPGNACAQVVPASVEERHNRRHTIRVGSPWQCSHQGGVYSYTYGSVTLEIRDASGIVWANTKPLITRLSCSIIEVENVARLSPSYVSPVPGHFFLPSTSRAAILAKASTIPEFVITASGQCLSAALRSRLKSSCVIFTFT